MKPDLMNKRIISALGITCYSKLIQCGKLPTGYSKRKSNIGYSIMVLRGSKGDVDGHRQIYRSKLHNRVGSKRINCMSTWVVWRSENSS